MHSPSIASPSARSARPSARREITGIELPMRPSLLVLLLSLLALLSSPGCRRESEPDLAARDVFLRYCASCHGADARGHGPLAASLTPPPKDLTRLALDNGGEFDESAVMASVDGRRQVAAHGSRDMPVWGAVFQEEGSDAPYPAYQSLLKTRLLVDYLASIQEEAPRIR